MLEALAAAAVVVLELLVVVYVVAGLLDLAEARGRLLYGINFRG